MPHHHLVVHRSATATFRPTCMESVEDLGSLQKEYRQVSAWMINGILSIDLLKNLPTICSGFRQYSHECDIGRPPKVELGYHKLLKNIASEI